MAVRTVWPMLCALWVQGPFGQATVTPAPVFLNRDEGRGIGRPLTYKRDRHGRDS